MNYENCPEPPTRENPGIEITLSVAEISPGNGCGRWRLYIRRKLGSKFKSRNNVGFEGFV
jgi:hypothetical protein